MKNNIYIITYDLTNPGRNYEELLKILKTQGKWARLGGSSYLVACDSTVIQLRDNLKVALDINDKIYVSLLSSPAAWYGLSQDVANWILDNQK